MRKVSFRSLCSVPSRDRVKLFLKTGKMWKCRRRKKAAPRCERKYAFSSFVAHELMKSSAKAPSVGGKIVQREPRESAFWESSTRIFFVLRNKIICLTFSNANDMSSEKSRWVVYGLSHSCTTYFFEDSANGFISSKHTRKSINLGLPHKKPFSLFFDWQKMRCKCEDKKYFPN